MSMHVDECVRVPYCRFHYQNRKPGEMVTDITSLRESTMCVCVCVCAEASFCVS